MPSCKKEEAKAADEAKAAEAKAGTAQPKSLQRLKGHQLIRQRFAE